MNRQDFFKTVPFDQMSLAHQEEIRKARMVKDKLPISVMTMIKMMLHKHCNGLRSEKDIRDFGWGRRGVAPLPEYTYKETIYQDPRLHILLDMFLENNLIYPASRGPKRQGKKGAKQAKKYMLNNALRMARWYMSTMFEPKR